MSTRPSLILSRPATESYRLAPKSSQGVGTNAMAKLEPPTDACATTWLPPVSSHLASAGAGPERYAAVVTPPVGGKREIRGSLEATRRSFNKDFLLALAADFKKHGAAAIEKVRKTQPAAYMKICAHLVPREMKLEHSGGVKAMPDEQIVDAIAAIEAWMAAQKAGEGAKVIEAVPEPVALPAPSRKPRRKRGAE